MRLNWGRTAVLGLGFFSISLVWSLYNGFMPVFYEAHIKSTALVGLIMTIDNVAAIFLQPYFGALSDRPLGRYGRRLPFFFIGAPLAALFFAFIPFVRTNLWLLLGLTIVMNLAMTVFRSPTIALMPDLTPPPLRSQANGIINLMGGLGALLIFFVGSRLYEAWIPLPFLIVAGVLVAVALVLRLAIKEPERPYGSEEDEGVSPGILRSLKGLLAPERRGVLWLLLAVFTWFMAYQPIENLFSLYGKNYLGVTEGDAVFSLGFFSLTFMLMAIPAGYLAARRGRRRTILLGLGLLGLIFVGMSALLPIANWLGWQPLWAARAFLIVGGLSWSFININSYPMIAEMAPAGQLGTYTGLYYFFSSVAAIAGPPLSGLVTDLLGWQSFFPLALLFLALSLCCMLQVRGGEAVQDG